MAGWLQCRAWHKERRFGCRILEMKNKLLQNVSMICMPLSSQCFLFCYKDGALFSCFASSSHSFLKTLFSRNLCRPPSPSSPRNRSCRRSRMQSGSEKGNERERRDRKKEGRLAVRKRRQYAAFASPENPRGRPKMCLAYDVCCKRSYSAVSIST